jgi:hypothetical protein
MVPIISAKHTVPAPLNQMGKSSFLLPVLVSLHLSTASVSGKSSAAFLPHPIGLHPRNQQHAKRRSRTISHWLSDERRLGLQQITQERLSRTQIHDIIKSLMKLKDRMKRVPLWCNMQQLITVLFSLALMFLAPLKSNAAASTASITSQTSSVEYYLQNDPNLGSPSSRSQERVISIQTKSPSTLVASPARRINRRKINNTQRSQHISLGLVVASLAAGSFRASLRKTKVVRNTTPFGIVRNASPLGNGVSVIRLRMALEISEDVGAITFLEKLQVEEYNLYATISMLAQQQQLTGTDVYGGKQKALAKYLSNGEFIC